MMSSRMNRNNSVVVPATAMAICLMLVTSAMAEPITWERPNVGAGEEWEGTTVDSSDGNPYLDHDGGEWTAYWKEVARSSAPADIQAWTGYAKATWSTTHGWTKQVDNDNFNYPGYDMAERMWSILSQADYEGAAWVNNPMLLTLTLPDAGDVSFDGTIEHNTDEVQLYIGYYDSSDVFTELYKDMDFTESLDLGSESALQNVSVGAGTKMAVIVSRTDTGSTVAKGVTLSGTDPMTITQIPEPATGVLFLGMLSLVALRRRRRG